MHSIFRSLLCLLLVALVPSLARADGFIVVTETRHFIPVPHHPVFAPLEVTSHKVSVRIIGQIATTTVDQEFFNPSDRTVEGTYFFPVPKDAQIDKFQMQIGDKLAEAELLDASKARGIYEDIVRQLKDPALLEYAGRQLFKARVFPIEGRSNKKLRITYTQLLKSDSGALTYQYPLATEKFSAKPIKIVSVEVEVNSDKPFASLYSPSHKVAIKRDDSGRRATITYEAKDEKPDSDFQLICTGETKVTDEVPINLLTYREPNAPADEDGYFLLLAAAAPEMKTAERKLSAKDVTFVLDTSGSMQGVKMDQAKKALAFCVGQLNPEDRFEIIRFSSATEPLFGKLTEATPSNRKRADDFIAQLRAMGGTAIHEALKTALTARPASSDRPYIVIFLTDGLANIGPSRNEEILDMVQKSIGTSGGVRVFSFGVGTDVNTHLLDQLAAQTRAFSTYVFPNEDLEIKLSNFFTKMTEPALTDLRIEFSGGEGTRFSERSPSDLPDLFQGDQVAVAGRYRGSGEVEVKLIGKRNGQERSFTTRVKLDPSADSSTAREFIPRLWATRRVAFLLDEIRLRGENAEIRDEVTRVARKFGIVTPYTAYLILEDEAKKNVPTERRLLGKLDGDRAARDVAATAYKDMKEQTGAAAVGGAESQNHTRRAMQATDALRSANEYALAAPKSAAAPVTVREAAGRVEQFTQQGSRFVNGRAFFQNGTQWVDSTLKNRADGARATQRVQFNSPEYFELLKQHPEASAWFALGSNVSIALGDTDYEIYN